MEILLSKNNQFSLLSKGAGTVNIGLKNRAFDVFDCSSRHVKSDEQINVLDQCEIDDNVRTFDSESYRIKEQLFEALATSSKILFMDMTGIKNTTCNIAALSVAINKMAQGRKEVLFVQATDDFYL